ncbi:MAG: type II secretion system protein [Planctomycetes bacterium]|nr:type II secretion system protein [Planctomycetota bacterium]
MSNKHGPAAFTLIELLVVVAIISLLASMLLPSLKQAKELAMRASCLAQLRNLGVSYNLYANENDGCFPHKEVNVSGYTDYFKDHKRHVIRESRKWVNSGVLIENEFLDIYALFCPSGWDYFRNDMWENRGSNPATTLFSDYSVHALYYWEDVAGQRVYKVAPRAGFSQQSDGTIPLASDCNVSVSSTRQFPGKEIPWYSTNVAMWHQEVYNVVYLDGRASTFQYDDDMFTGQSWYVTSNCTNWAFFNFVTGK